MKNVILTGERPTGPLHIGHYVGSLKKRIEMQNSNLYDIYILVADLQALTDNFDNPKKIRDNIMEVVLDNLSVGIDPNKCTFVIQSQIPALHYLPLYYENLVTLSRLERNPTVKKEIIERNFNKSLPVGFVNYPISQAADITAFKATHIPVGEDQLPMIEQTREIVDSFNKTYKTDILVKPVPVLSSNLKEQRLPGIDGKEKMSKSLGNTIYLKDDSKTVYKKVMMMYTDPNHIKVEDKGKVEGNTVFTYLDCFCNDALVKKYLSNYNTLDEIKKHYENGGLGDVTIKKLLYNCLEEFLTPIRERRAYYEARKEEVFNMLIKHTKKAVLVSNETLKEVRDKIGINYFEDEDFKKENIKN